MNREKPLVQRYVAIFEDRPYGDTELLTASVALVGTFTRMSLCALFLLKFLGFADYAAMSDGDVTAPPTGFPTLAAYVGTSVPFLDVTYTLPLSVGEPPSVRGRVLPASPNPFRLSTSIRFELSQAASVRLEIFDLRGARVAVLKDGNHLAAGGHATTWDGRDHAGRLAPPGIYMVRLEAGGESWSGRVVRIE